MTKSRGPVQLFNPECLLSVPTPGYSHRHQDTHTYQKYLHGLQNDHTAPDTLTHSAGLCPWLSPGTSLVRSSPLRLSPLCFLAGLLSISEVAMWWEGQSLHLPVPPESASIQQSLLFWAGPFPIHPGPQSPQSSNEPRKHWTVMTRGTRQQTSN